LTFHPLAAKPTDRSKALVIKTRLNLWACFADSLLVIKEEET